MPDSAELLRLLDAQRDAFRRRPPGYAERIANLERLEEALVRRQDDFVQAISADFGGRAAEETLALEIFPVLNDIRHARKSLKGWMESYRVPVPMTFWPARARVTYQARGVVGILAPWNYPVFLTLGPLVGALAAGNHVMLKPSELTPATAQLLEAVTGEFFAPDVVTVINGDAGVAAEFTGLPFDHLLFTGSARVAKLVMKAAAANLTPVTLELGGKSPAILHPEYPLRRAVERIIMGKLYNAGQTCVAPDYVLAPEPLSERFVELAREVTARLYPRLVANPDYTRIINERHYARLQALVEEARGSGARVVELNPAREACTAANRVFPPTLVLGARDDSAVMQEEIFGPVLPVVGYRQLDDALAYVNARPHPLALYYFDDNASRVREVLARTTAGGSTVNDCIFHVGQPNLPFGGVGPSGMGRYHGFDGFETFSHKRGIFLQARWSPLALLRPPYGQTARRILRHLVGS